MIRQAAPPPPRWARRAATPGRAHHGPVRAVADRDGRRDPRGRQRPDPGRPERLPRLGDAVRLRAHLLLVGLASLTLDLVQQWGETVPRWIPLLGGRPVPPLAAVIPAVTGAIALTVLWAGTMANIEPIWAYYALEGRERVLMMVCYAPLLLWDPLLTAVTISYYRRRHRCAAFPTTRDGFAGTDWADLPSDQPGMADDAAQQQAGTRRRWLSESAGLHPPLVGG